MTKIEELEQKMDMIKIDIGNLGLELSDCQKALAELKESKKEGKWKPILNHEYWYRDSAGIICNTFYVAHAIDEWRINNIPIFPTKEECERYWHFMDTVKEKSYEFSKEEWEDVDIPKFIVKRNYEKDYFEVSCFQSIKYFNTTYFKTEEDANYIIDNFKDELMEYWL